MNYRDIRGFSKASWAYENATPKETELIPCRDCIEGLIPCNEAACDCPCQDSPEVAAFHSFSAKMRLESGECCSHNCPTCKGEGKVGR